MVDRLADNIKRYRLMRGLDQTQLAEALAVSRVTYSKIETGKVKPSDDLFYRLARVFEVDPVMLLENSVPRARSFARQRKLRTLQEKAFNTQMLLDAERRFADYEYLEEISGESGVKSWGLQERARSVNGVEDARRFGSEIRELFFSKGYSSIRQLGDALEADGIKYLTFPFLTASEFGFTLRMPSGTFAIAINTNGGISGERQLFTLCHEVGHLLMHFRGGLPDDLSVPQLKAMEKEADAFASGLLLPDTEFEMAWKNTEGDSWFNRILSVKKIFLVSYQTVLRRLDERFAKENPCGKLPPYRIWFHQNFQRRFGRSLPMREEACPSDIRIESSRYVRLARKLFLDGELTMSRLAEILGKNLLATRDIANGWVREGAV